MGDLAARREARMRKILENSENRLRRIGGVENKSIQEIPPVNIRNSTHGDHTEPESNDGHHHGQDLDLDHPYNRFTLSHNSSSVLWKYANTVPPRTVEQLMTSDPTPSPEDLVLGNTYSDQGRALVICAIATVYCVITTISHRIFSESSDSHLNAVFAPLFMFELYELTFLHRRPNVGTLISTILLCMESRTGRGYANVMKVLIRIGDVLHDLLLYFFVYAVCNLVASSVV